MEYNDLQAILSNSDNVVFFGGAGVSTESGIPDFRSTDGLYNQKYRSPPETILSHTFFTEQPKAFFDFYRDKMLFLHAKPNPAHKYLARLEEKGKLKAVVTQNIDGLHQAAGSKNVLELHGNVYRNYCIKCGKFFGVEKIVNATGVPLCSCGGTIKPDVVLYEEGLDDGTVERAIEFISKSDVLIVGGTSLNVYPAAGLVRYFSGSKLIMINKSATLLDGQADLIISESIGAVLGAIRI
jgi:NAD-dependent deacetylase